MFCSSAKSLYMRMILFYALPLNLQRTNKRKINADLGRICKWFRANQLRLNVKKSNFSLIGASSSSHLSKGGSIHIFADDVPPDNVDSYTYLGIVINNQLTTLIKFVVRSATS